MTNFKKVIDMKNIKESISDELCEFCMTDRQQAERSRVFRIKIKEFLERLNIDIEINLSITVRDNKHFVFFKDNK